MSAPCRVVENASRRRGVAQPGSAPGSGPGSRRFKSSRPDKRSKKNREKLRGFFVCGSVALLLEASFLAPSKHAVVEAAAIPWASRSGRLGRISDEVDHPSLDILLIEGVRLLVLR